MSTMLHLIANSQKKIETRTLIMRLADRFNGLNERFWFLTTFILFVVMGPFSVLAVMIGLFSLAKNQANQEASEPVSLH
ncbi:MAG: hypothetical protein ACLFV2_08055 [Desulfurivibrionaceae bacterium]